MSVSVRNKISTLFVLRMSFISFSLLISPLRTFHVPMISCLIFSCSFLSISFFRSVLLELFTGLSIGSTAGGFPIASVFGIPSVGQLDLGEVVPDFGGAADFLDVQSTLAFVPSRLISS